MFRPGIETTPIIADKMKQQRPLKAGFDFEELSTNIRISSLGLAKASKQTLEAMQQFTEAVNNTKIKNS